MKTASTSRDRRDQRAGAGTSELRLTRGKRLQDRAGAVDRLDGDLKALFGEIALADRDEHRKELIADGLGWTK